MLKKIDALQTSASDYVQFASITHNSHGKGKCFAYGATIKNTKYGAPFVILNLRDINGVSLVGYVFDLQSPLLAGDEATKVVNKIVTIDWTENYIANRGLTLLINSIGIHTNPSTEELSMFSGEIENSTEKQKDIADFCASILGIRISLSLSASTMAFPDYAQGKVGGLVEHYWKMTRLLQQITDLTDKEYKQLISTFVLYICMHPSYLRAKQEGSAGIEFVNKLTDSATSLTAKLGNNVGALEIVNQFYGYTPKDIYVRTILNISDTVQRIEKEFSVYRLTPVNQDANAGYGVFTRYGVNDV